MNMIVFRLSPRSSIFEGSFSTLFGVRMEHLRSAIRSAVRPASSHTGCHASKTSPKWIGGLVSAPRADAFQNVLAFSPSSLSSTDETLFGMTYAWVDGSKEFRQSHSSLAVRQVSQDVCRRSHLNQSWRLMWLHVELYFRPPRCHWAWCKEACSALHSNHFKEYVPVYTLTCATPFGICRRAGPNEY